MHLKSVRSFYLIALLTLGSCAAALVTQSTVNHAYEGRLRRLVLYNTVFEGLRQSLTASFDTQFTADMDRCGVQVRIVDSTGVELNPRTRLMQAAQEIQADSLLTAIWTKRETGRNSQQYSVFTLSQIAPAGQISLGEVWKTEMLQVGLGMKLAGDDDGTILARRVVDQLEKDKMLVNCPPRQAPTSSKPM